VEEKRREKKRGEWWRREGERKERKMKIWRMREEVAQEEIKKRNVLLIWIFFNKDVSNDQLNFNIFNLFTGYPFVKSN
jgi:hypothetical protein